MDRGKTIVDPSTNPEPDRKNEENNIDRPEGSNRGISEIIKDKDRKIDYWRQAYVSENKRFKSYRAWAEQEIENLKAEIRNEPPLLRPQVERPITPTARCIPGLGIGIPSPISGFVGGSPSLRLTPRKRVGPIPSPLRITMPRTDANEEDERDENTRDIPVDEASITYVQGHHIEDDSDRENDNDSDNEDSEGDPEEEEDEEEDPEEENHGNEQGEDANE